MKIGKTLGCMSYERLLPTPSGEKKREVRTSYVLYDATGGHKAEACYRFEHPRARASFDLENRSNAVDGQLHFYPA